MVNRTPPSKERKPEQTFMQGPSLADARGLIERHFTGVSHVWKTCRYSLPLDGFILAVVTPTTMNGSPLPTLALILIAAITRSPNRILNLIDRLRAHVQSLSGDKRSLLVSALLLIGLVEIIFYLQGIGMVPMLLFAGALLAGLYRLRGQVEFNLAHHSIQEISILQALPIICARGASLLATIEYSRGQTSLIDWGLVFIAALLVIEGAPPHRETYLTRCARCLVRVPRFWKGACPSCRARDRADVSRHSLA